MSEECGVCTDDIITLMILPYLKVITNEGTKYLLLILTVRESIIIPIKTVLKTYSVCRDKTYLEIFLNSSTLL